MNPIENPYLNFINPDGSISHTAIEQVSIIQDSFPDISEQDKKRLDRDEFIISLYEQGYTQANIAHKIGLSRERIRQIVGKERTEARAAQVQLEIQVRKTVEQVCKLLRWFSNFYVEHGEKGYNQRHCRCDICKAANAARHRAMYKNNPKIRLSQIQWMKDNPDKVKKYIKKYKKNTKRKIRAGEFTNHGKVGYALGCRCEICTKEYLTYRKVSSQKMLAEGRVNHGHTGYQHGCRCDICKLASREYRSGLYYKNKNQ